MKVTWHHADGPQKKVYMDSWPSDFPLPLVGDFLSGLPGKPEISSKIRVYEVTGRRWHIDWQEVQIFLKPAEGK